MISIKEMNAVEKIIKSQNKNSEKYGGPQIVNQNNDVYTESMGLKCFECNVDLQFSIIQGPITKYIIICPVCKHKHPTVTLGVNEN